MKIWLINPYGPIPIPEENWREYRFTIIGNYLSSIGHEVVWYTSSFSHHFKKQRSVGWKDIEINNKFKIRLVPNPGYTKNISFGRIKRDLIFSRKVFYAGITSNEKPELIIYSESPLSFGYAGYKLARKLRIPVIFDQMDLWPELMINSFPKKLQKLITLFFAPVFISRKNIYNKLDGFISLAEPYMSIPMSFASNIKTKPYAIIYNGIDVVEFRKDKPVRIEFLNTLPTKEENEVWFTFAGTLGPSYDILNLIKVAETLLNEGRAKIRILIAGDGPLKKEVNEFEKKNNGSIIKYLGQLRPDDLIELYKKSDVGLSIYTEISNVEMPDKFYDYTAAGLPIINSLKGEVGHIIAKEGIGLNYKAGDSTELYNAIVKLSSDIDILKDMSSRSFNIGLYYDKNFQIKKIETIINTILGNTIN